MAKKTNVPAEFERRYNSEMQPPEDVIKQMRREITDMRKDLIRKQNRLENNKLYRSNPALKEELQEIKVRNLKSPGEVQNTYFKMRQYEKSNRTSVTGMRKSAQKSLKTLQLGRYGDTLGKVVKNERDLAAYGEFMDWVRDNYSIKALGYQRVLNWYVDAMEEDEDPGYNELENPTQKAYYTKLKNDNNYEPSQGWNQNFIKAFEKWMQDHPDMVQ